MSTSPLKVRSPEDFNSDTFEQSVIALQVETEKNDVEHLPHRHRKGQLILSLQGAVTCEVAEALWLVPPQHAVWIPGTMSHKCRATRNALLFFLFVEPGVTTMPDRCCTVAITPLVREMIRYLAGEHHASTPDARTERLVAVLLEHLSSAPIEELHFPVSDHPKIRLISDALISDPADRTTLRQWAARLATSERSLARLVETSTGLTFGRWRQQLHLLFALRQLAEGQPVQNVAGNLGYDSVNAFITMFKKALGKSPTQYSASLSEALRD